MDAAAVGIERGTVAAAAITVAGVSKWFDTADGQQLQALKDVDLDVPAQSILAILGASGCGKSTLLNIISGIQSPDRGQVCINGVPSKDFAEWRTVSYIFQEDRLLPWRTALRNVEFALEAGSMAQEERTRRAREVLQLVELAGFAEAFPYQLSGGMRSRVALARSLVTEPRILLMDEPFSRLDAQTRESMHEELLRVYQLKQMTVVFVTHDVSEAVLLADQVAVMAPRPGTIREVIDIGLSRPRNVTEPEVTRYMQRLRALI
jgi:ABC-type nitrate/sulfonate/bicarbonate transport system ATPase subunit